MWIERTSSAFVVMIAASILAHVGLLVLLPPATHAAVTRPSRASTLVTMEAIASPLAPPPIAALPAPPPVVRDPVARTPRPVTQSRAGAAARPNPIAAAEPPPSAESPADLTGVTLTNDAPDAGWSSPIGNGATMTAPTGTPGPKNTGRGPGGAVGGIGATVGTDRVVALGDLSRPPRAPELDAELAANYPRDARRAGIPGSAVVRARILVDGRVGPTRVLSETAPGFGAACQRTLAGSRWQPPLDARNHAVATDLVYTCAFEVSR
jgi:outer membrane biosynthesis protein TonB